VTSISPAQNAGIARPIWLETETNVSAGFRWRAAANTPAVKATRMVIVMAMNASGRVTFSLSVIWPPMPIPEKKDTPRSPLIADPAQSKYRTRNGRFSPSS